MKALGYLKTVIATVLKKAEDEAGYILRCYEAIGSATAVTIEIPVLDRRWKSKLGKNEIKTILIPNDKEKQVTEVNLLEMY